METITYPSSLKEANELQTKYYHGRACVPCSELGLTNTLKVTKARRCVECNRRRARAKSSSMNTPLHDNMEIRSSNRDLISCILLCALNDSKSPDKNISFAARYWILSDVICEFYCWLLGIDYNVMIERVTRRW